MSLKPSESTAAEILAKLACDAGYLQKQEVQEVIRLQRAAFLESASKPLMDDLRRLGVELRSVWSRFDSDEDRVNALPVLRHHLDLDYPDETLEGIARAMAIPQAAPYRKDVIALFRRIPPVSPNLRYALGLVIAATTTSKNLPETIGLLRDRAFGESRMALLRAIRKLRMRQEIQDLIADLVDDPDLSIEIASWK